MIPSRPVISRPRAKKQKRVKLPPPSQLLFGHAVVDGKVVPVLSTTAGTVEHHAMQNGVLKAHFDAAKAMRRWPNGAEVTEEAFLATIDAVTGMKVGGFPTGIVAVATPAPSAAPTPPTASPAASSAAPAAAAPAKTEVQPPATKASSSKAEAK